MWIWWLTLDTTHTCSMRFWITNLDIPFISPWWSPRVLDKIVRSVVFFSVSNSKYTMIKMVSTSTGDDTTLVGLESSLVSLDGNWNWLLGNCLHKIGLALLFHISVSCNHDTFGWVHLTVLVFLHVWVGFFRGEPVFFNKVESVIHKSTTASVVKNKSSVTVNKLLFWELN